MKSEPIHETRPERVPGRFRQIAFHAPPILRVPCLHLFHFLEMGCLQIRHSVRMLSGQLQLFGLKLSNFLKLYSLDLSVLALNFLLVHVMLDLKAVDTRLSHLEAQSVKASERHDQHAGDLPKFHRQIVPEAPNRASLKADE